MPPNEAFEALQHGLGARPRLALASASEHRYVDEQIDATTSSSRYSAPIPRLSLNAGSRETPDATRRNMLIRSEQREDIDAIHALHVASFPTESEAKLVHALRAAAHLSASVIALENDEVIGHAAFSPVTVEGVSGGLGLGPVAVHADQRRRGVAELLVRDGLDICRHRTAGFVVVLGHPGYYSRFGFHAAQRWQLRDEYDGGDAFQALELVPGAIPLGGGLVRYSPEFAALGV